MNTIKTKSEVTKMGSAKIDSKSQLNECTNKKSIKNILQSIFQKDSKKRSKKEDTIVIRVEKRQQEPVKATPVANLLQNFSKLKLESITEADDELKNFTIKTIDERGKNENSSTKIEGFSEKTIEPKTGEDRDVSKNVITNSDDKDFSKKTIIENKKREEVEDEDLGFSVKSEAGRINRFGSNSSDDSGFSEKTIAESLNKLNLSNEKKKKVQTVFVSRGPIRRALHGNLKHPYQQISQINKQTFSGGQVIVASHDTQNLTQADESVEISKALSQVDAGVNIFSQGTSEEQNIYFEIASDFVTDDNLLSDFDEILKEPNHEFIPYMITNVGNLTNSVGEFNSSFTYNGYEAEANYEFPVDSEFCDPVSSILTPPRSNEPQFSPSMQSPSFYSPPYQINNSSPQTDYTSSPDRSSPNNFHDTENEKYQVFDKDDLPVSVSDGTEWKAKSEKLSRSSSISMKSIKDAQKQLQASFSKESCCKRDVESLKKIYHKHFLNVSSAQRKNICMKIAEMDYKTAYGVLHHILISLSSGMCEQDSIQYTMFYLICQQVLAQKPALFMKDFGLNLLIAASLRCHSRVEFVKLLVRTIRTALVAAKYEHSGPLFTGVDSRGDNLIGALARCGDTHADVLTEIVIRNAKEIALFDVNHANTEGFSPLHLACASHNTTEVGSSLRTVHVLLAHAGADLYKGDNKAGDTALHVAVNSITCDFRLVQTLFLHVDRKFWKQLAHVTNRSSVTPLEYARSATKSAARHNYPPEVLDMLKKCR